MELPFPGMDPYLEATSLWPDVHGRLAVAISDQLQPLLSPRYTAVLTPYTAIEAIEITSPRFIVPDVGVLDRGDVAAGAAVAIAPAPITGVIPFEVPVTYHTVEVRTVAGDTLVTAIEVLSPANKRPGVDGADAYHRKRGDILLSRAHLLEIDLLRAGRRPQVRADLPDAPYFVTLSRQERRPHVEIWPVLLTGVLPVVPVPLQSEDPDVPLDLGACLRRIYASARYDLRVDYRTPPPPPELNAADGAWLDAHLRSVSMR